MPAFRAPSKLLLSLPLVLLFACAPTAAPAANTAVPPTAAAPAQGAASNPSASASVQLTDALKFEPASLTVSRGTTVTWRNVSAVPHTVTDDPSKAANPADAQLPAGVQPWDSGNLNADQTFTHTFDTPGTYKYFCQPHEAAGMVGTITVTP